MKNEHAASHVARIIDYLMFSVLGVFCLQYASYNGRRFAEMHIQFNGLNFPIFLGEFLLLGCCVLFAVRCCFERIKLNRWHVIIGLYFLFVLAKAFLGYRHWGALALRDSAMFYYFAFAIFGYYCYRPEYFSKYMIFGLYSILIWSYLTDHYNPYWVFVTTALGLILAYRFPNRWVGILMGIAIIVLTPYQYFINNARMIILGNYVGCSFLIVVAAICVPLQKRVKISVALGLIVMLWLIIFSFSGQKAASTIFQWHSIIDLFKKEDEAIQIKKKKYNMVEISGLKVYNPEPLRPKAKVVLDETSTVEASRVADEQSISTAPHVSDQDAMSTMAQSSDVGVIPPFSANEAAKSSELVVPLSAPLPTTVNDVAGAVIPAAADEKPGPLPTFEGIKLNNAVFRLFIWRDMLEDLMSYKPIFGFDFGKPFRSVSIEILHWAHSEWSRDGWLAAHNSFLNIIYRAGIFGVAFVVVFWMVFFNLVWTFIRFKSVVGLLMCAILLAWFVATNFLLILELPYTAIPVWTMYGITLAYAHRLLKPNAGTSHELKK